MSLRRPKSPIKGGSAPEEEEEEDILNNTGERPHPCLIPLFMYIGSDILYIIKFNSNLRIPVNIF